MGKATEKEKVFIIKLTAEEMRLALESIKASAYRGADSEKITAIKDKLKPRNSD